MLDIFASSQPNKSMPNCTSLPLDVFRRVRYSEWHKIYHHFAVLCFVVVVMSWEFTGYNHPYTPGLIQWCLNKSTIVIFYDVVFRIINPWWRISNRHRCIPLKRINNAALWRFLCSRPIQVVEQTVQLRVVWANIILMWRHGIDGSNKPLSNK